MGISIRIKGLMEKKGVSAYTISSETGISQSTLSRLLNKDSKPNAGNLKIISDYFQVDQSWLLTGIEYKNFKTDLKPLKKENLQQNFF